MSWPFPAIAFKLTGQIGCRFVKVDAKRDQRAIRFYENYGGFIKITQNSETVQMVVDLNKIDDEENSITVWWKLFSQTPQKTFHGGMGLMLGSPEKWLALLQNCWCCCVPECGHSGPVYLRRVPGGWFGAGLCRWCRKRGDATMLRTDPHRINPL